MLSLVIPFLERTLSDNSIRLLSRTTVNDHGLAVNVQISRNLKTLAYGANPHLILHSVPRSKLCFKVQIGTDTLT